jgi:hypothetical protein
LGGVVGSRKYEYDVVQATDDTPFYRASATSPTRAPTSPTHPLIATGRNWTKAHLDRFEKPVRFMIHY